MISNFAAPLPLAALVLAIAGGVTAALPASAPRTTGEPPQQEAVAIPEPPAAAAEDVESLDGIIAALYDVISGEKIGPDGENQRDWDRFRSLFHPVLGRLIPLAPNYKDPANPTWTAMGMRPNDYVEQGSRFMAQTAFYEKEIHRVEEVFGGIAHVWSTYEGRNERDAEEAFLRGVNSIQAMYDGKRWWILVVAWDAERPGQQLPAKYLPKK